MVLYRIYRIYKFFDKKTRSMASVNEQLGEKLHKPVTKKFKRRKFYAKLKGSILAADLVEMGSLYSKNKNVKYSLCIIHVFTKDAWFKPLKDKKGKQFLMLFWKWLMNLLVNQINYGLIKEKNFIAKIMQEWLENNNILMYSTHNEGKSVIAERVIKALKAKIYKNITANDSKSYLSYLNKLVDQYRNTYHHSIDKKRINDDYSVLTE